MLGSNQEPPMRTNAVIGKDQESIADLPMRKNPLIRYKFALYYRQFARYRRQLEVDELDIMDMSLPKRICCQIVSKYFPHAIDTVHELYDSVESGVLRACMKTSD